MSQQWSVAPGILGGLDRDRWLSARDLDRSTSIPGQLRAVTKEKLANEACLAYAQWARDGNWDWIW